MRKKPYHHANQKVWHARTHGHEAEHANDPIEHVELARSFQKALRELQKLSTGQTQDVVLTATQFNQIAQLMTGPSGQPNNELRLLLDAIAQKSGVIKVGAPQSTPTTVGSTATLNGVGASLVITGSAGSDTLYGGSSADTIDGGGGADVIFGGDGDDVFYFTPSALAQLALLNGGLGTDTILLTEAGMIDDAGFVNVNLVEVLALTGASNIVLGSAARQAGILKVVLGAGATNINWQMPAIPLQPDNVFSVDASAGGNISLTGGWGGDITINVNGLNGINQVVDGSLISNGLSVTANSNAQSIIGSLQAANAITGGGGADTILGGYQSDSFYFRQGDLSALVSLDSVGQTIVDPDTGETYVQDGTDTLIISEASTNIVDADFSHVNNMDYLQLTGASAAALGTNFAATGINVLITGMGNTQLTAEASIALDIDASQMQSGSTLTLAQTTGVDASFSVSNLQADLFAQGISGGLNVNTANVSALNIQSSSGSMSVGGGAVSVVIDATPLWPDALLSLSDASSYTIQRLVANIDASASTGLVTLSLSDASDDQIQVVSGFGNLTLTNGSATDTVNINGLNSADQTLDGSVVFSRLNVAAGDGHQILVGGLGADTISGGVGADEIDLSSSAITLSIDGLPIDPDPSTKNTIIINLDQISYGDSGQTGVAQIVAGTNNIVDTTNLDIVTGLGLFGGVELYAAAGVLNQASIIAGETLLTSNTVGQASLVTGLWDSINQQFTVQTASDINDDLLFQWADGVSVQTVVLSGDYFDAGTTIKMLGNAENNTYMVWTTLF